MADPCSEESKGDPRSNGMASGPRPRKRTVSLTRTQSGTDLYIVSSQIGGSVPLLKDSLGRVCKPAAQAEKAFYEELPSVYPFLVKYTPAYYGCCTVNVRRVLRDISAHLENYHTNHTPRVYPDGTASTQTPVPVQKNWNAFQVRHKKMERDADGNVEFIMLEDLTRNHRYSNVLDIKLGSAQYSAQHDAARTKQMDPKQRAKMARAIEKCNNSTSHKYGFRVNGMQIYREDKQLYKVMDKFACRSLDISGTDRVLERFLKYPTWNNLDQLRTLIADLKDLAAALRRTCWRFYGLSLLLSYDPSQVKPECEVDASGSVGSEESDKSCSSSSLSSSSSSPVPSPRRRRIPNSNRVDIRLIDFAKCERRRPESNSEGSDEQEAQPHEGVVSGIENLTQVLEDIERRHSERRAAMEVEKQREKTQARHKRCLLRSLATAILGGAAAVMLAASHSRKTK